MKALFWKSHEFGNKEVRAEMVLLADHLTEEFVQMNIKNGTQSAMDVRELVVSGFHAAIFALQSDDAKQHFAELNEMPTLKGVVKWLETQAFIAKNEKHKTFATGRVLS